MDIRKRLRLDSLRRMLPVCLALLAAGVAVFFLFGCHSLVRLALPRALAELSVENMEGAYVEDDVTYLYAAYAQEVTYQDDRPVAVTGAQYVIQFDGEHYMGLFAHQDTLDEAEAMLSACDAYYTGELREDELPALRVRGVIRSMDEQTLAYYLAAADGDEDVREVMLPYYIDVNRLNGRPFAVTWAALAAAVLLMLAGIALGLYALLGGCQRKMRAKCAGSEEEVEQFCQRTEAVGGVRLGPDYILFQSRTESVLLRPWEVSWAYVLDVWPPVNGGMPTAMVFRTVDKKKYVIPMSEENTQTLMDLICQWLPGVVRGFSQEKERAYLGDPTFSGRWEAVWPGCTGRK